MTSLREDASLACRAILEALGGHSDLPNGSTRENLDGNSRSSVDVVVQNARRQLLIDDLSYKARDLTLGELDSALVRYCVPADVHAVREKRKGMLKADDAGRRVLFLITTPNEVMAARAVFAIEKKDKPVSFEGYKTWTFTLGEAVTASTGVLAVIGVRGAEAAQNACRTLVAQFDATAVVLCGMTAGVRGKTNLGDVLSARVVINPEPERREKGAVLPRPREYSVPDPRWREMTYFLSDPAEWWDGLKPALERLKREQLPTEVKENWTPNAIEAYLLSQSALLADGSLPATRQLIDERIRGSEMEAAGVCSACDEMRIPWWIIKAVADFGDAESKDAPDFAHLDRKAWQFPATIASLVFARNFVRSLA